MIQVKLWFFAEGDLLSIDVDKYALCSSQDLQPGIDSDRLANTKMEDRVVPIWYMLQIDVRFATQIWLIVISLNGCHSIFVESHHPFWYVVNQGTWIVNVILIMLKELSKLLKLVSCAEAWVDHVVVGRIELRNDVNDVIQSEHAHIIVD